MKWLKNLVIGRARSLSDGTLFQKVSLIAVLGWVGLGADGLSSSCYGPEQAFRTLGDHAVLVLFVGLATLITIAILCTSYSKIIELFPGGGGGYVVASKLLSPAAGAASGCALIVDYVLTIALSMASGADALFSVLPPAWQPWKLAFALAGTALLSLLNLRGVKESVLILAPIFFFFLLTHGLGLIIGLAPHLGDLPAVAANTASDLNAAHIQLGWAGVFLLLARAYSVGAGTFTGIETVSNGLPVLREPRVATGKRTMVYIGLSLGLTVGGLMLAYMFYSVQPHMNKTLNAVLFEQMTVSWSPGLGKAFVSAAMLSAMALLFVGAQAGFVGGPRVLANMALDRWFPARFAFLSDRFVTQNGILLMGGSALLVLLLTRGAVVFLVVLYSINVFISFTLSQLGMLSYWWHRRAQAPEWKSKVLINGIGFILTAFILITLSLTKFMEGGWVTLLITGALIGVAFAIRRHYYNALRKLARLNDLVREFAQELLQRPSSDAQLACDPAAKTAVLFVNGFNGLGAHTLLRVIRMFHGVFKNFVFIQVGMLDAGNFKGASEIENLREHVVAEAERYVEYMRRHGFYAEALTDIGTDIIEVATQLASEAAQRFPQAVFFGGQLVFSDDSWMTRLLHNFVVFALQRRIFRRGLPFLIMPIRV